MTFRFAWVAVLCLAAGAAGAARQSRTGREGAAPPPKQETHKQQGTHKEISGEAVFEANCSRCHAAPMALSPRVTGTVVMHMRVRARLSQKEQEALLRFLAP